MKTAAANLSEIATHLGISRTAARDLEIQGVITRTGGLDACRLSYIRHLRARRSNAVDDRLRLARAKAIVTDLRERLMPLVAGNPKSENKVMTELDEMARWLEENIADRLPVIN
jgi:hypothetical protein